MAIASAISLSEKTRFTEIDFWDSPQLFDALYSSGNRFYNEKDEYSFKYTQITSEDWIHLNFDLLPYIKSCWGDLDNALLECVYIVIESDCRNNPNEDTVSLDIKNLFIYIKE